MSRENEVKTTDNNRLDFELEDSIFAAIIYFATERPKRLLVQASWEFLRVFEYAVIAFLHSGAGYPGNQTMPETMREAIGLFGKNLPADLKSILLHWDATSCSCDSTGEVGPNSPILIFWSHFVWECDALGTKPHVWSVPDSERKKLLKTAQKLSAEVFTAAASIGIHFQRGVDFEIDAYSAGHFAAGWRCSSSQALANRLALPH